MRLNEDDREYAAGFFDGDGSVYITVEAGSVYRLGVRVSSTNKNALNWLQERFGGWVVRQKDERPNRRIGWQWVSSSADAAAFLSFIEGSVVIKKSQVTLALNFLRRKERRLYRMSQDELTAREEIRLRLIELKKNVNLQAPAGRPAIPYIAGFFDAEGSVSILVSSTSACLEVKITNTVLSSLTFIRRAIGGRIHGKDSTLDRHGCHRLQGWGLHLKSRVGVNALLLMKPYLIVKCDQANLGIQYQAEKELVGRRFGRHSVGEKFRKLMIDLNERQNPVVAAV